MADPYAEFAPVKDAYAEFKAVPTAPEPSDPEGEAANALAEGPVAGAAENVLAGITGGAGSLADALTGSDPGTHNWAYQPRTETGKVIQKTVSDVASAAGQVANEDFIAPVVKAWGGDPEAARQTLAERVPEALGAVGTISALGGLAKAVVAPKEAPATIPEAAQEAANKAAPPSGAAGTPVNAADLTPETQAELARIHSSGGTVNATALGRIHEAESLPVPVSLTAGQATGEAEAISQEFNMKGDSNNAIGTRFDAQDQALKDNLSTLHREASPLTVANDDIQNGQAVIDSLKRYDQPKVAAINAAYAAAKDANGGDLQMDGTGFAAKAEASLKPQGRGMFLPSSVQKIIDNVKTDGQMSLDDFEGYRTALANESRKATMTDDGNAVAAISKVRDALEDTPPIGASAGAKALYDNARTLAKARFSELDSDPAYDAAVSDSAPIGEQSDLADKFVSKYVLGGSKAALQRLRPKLDEEGSQAMTSSAMNLLQKKAGINPDTGAGRFSSAGYNSGLTNIAPKAQELLGAQDLIDNTRKLGNVANYTQQLSRGSFANTSHTFVAEKAAEVGEHAVNVAAHGLPVGTIARKFLASRSKAAAVQEALKPGAGLED